MHNGEAEYSPIVFYVCSKITFNKSLQPAKFLFLEMHFNNRQRHNCFKCNKYVVKIPKLT